MASTLERKTASSLADFYASQIKGKVILTTGVSPSGLGAVYVKAIARSQPALLILAGRNPAKIQETADAISAEYPGVKTRALELNLGSLADVRNAAKKVNGWNDVPKIDVLVNNAGIMAVDYSVSPEGYESQLATNHLGPFLFTNLIMDKILASETPRIVIVSSNGHRFAPFRFSDYNFQDGKKYNRWQAYGQSKTANMLMALSLAENLGAKRKLLSYSLHPGAIFTGLGTHLDWEVSLPEMSELDQFMGNIDRPVTGMDAFKIISPEEGAATHIFASFDPDLAAKNGSYLEACEIADPWTTYVKPWGTSSVEAARLWKLSEKLVGQEFNY